jgi:hypothetical protein
MSNVEIFQARELREELSVDSGRQVIKPSILILAGRQCSLVPMGKTVVNYRSPHQVLTRRSLMLLLSRLLYSHDPRDIVKGDGIILTEHGVGRVLSFGTMLNLATCRAGARSTAVGIHYTGCPSLPNAG